MCHSHDAIRRVSNIIDAASSTTKGESDSLNLDNLDVTVTSHKFTTVGALAARFEIRDDHKRLTNRLMFAGLVVGVVIGAVFAAYTPLWYMAFILPLVAPLVLGMMDAANPAKAARHSEAVARARAGYYCARDDVAFLRGGPALSPEQYVKTLTPA